MSENYPRRKENDGLLESLFQDSSARQDTDMSIPSRSDDTVSVACADTSANFCVAMQANHIRTLYFTGKPLGRHPGMVIPHLTEEMGKVVFEPWPHVTRFKNQSDEM